MKLPNYLFIAPQSLLTGAGIIIQTSKPCVYANVIKFKSTTLFDDYISKNAGYPVGKVTGYNIVVAYAGTLDEASTIHMVSHEMLRNVLNEMAEYYRKEKIMEKQKTFKWLLRFIWHL